MAKYTIEGDFGTTIEMKVFSQCCGAGIDLYVNWVTTVFSKQFKLSVKGQRNINNALNNLPVYRTPDDKLTFGWTPDHALRNRGVAVHAGGYEHVGLEGTLSAAFPEVYTARVLYELAQLSAGEGDVTPHFDRWRTFVQSSDGIFATTDYGILVENYIRLYRRPSEQIGDQQDLRIAAAPARGLAEALHALAHLTQDSQQQIIIAGGPVVGWLAAFIDWLLDLPFAIFSSHGECLHKSAGTGVARVLLVYTEAVGELKTQIDSWGQDEEKARDISSQRRALSKGPPPDLRPFGGRLAWNSILTRVFGQSFLHLVHEQSSDFALSLGCAARIVSNLADLGGPNLAQILTTWLPELYRFRNRMEQQMELSQADACKVYCERMEKLKKTCCCHDCLPHHAESNAMPDQPLGSYCLPVLVESILALGIQLSMLTVAPQLYPAREGISRVYEENAGREGDLKFANPQNVEARFKCQLEYPVNLRILKAIEIFTGFQPDGDTPENLMALSYEGICAYSLDLERPGGVQNFIRVVSGNICWRHKIFRRACLGPERPGDDWEDFWERIDCDYLPAPLYCK